MTSTAYRAELAGFSKTFTSLDALRSWVHMLRDQHSWVIGETLRIWKGEDLGAGWATFTGPVAREIVVQ